MAEVQRTSLTAILTAVAAQLVTVTGVPSNRVRKLARDEDPEPLNGDQDLLLRVGGFRAVLGSRDRHDCRIRQDLEVTLRTRVQLDVKDRDDYLLTDSTKGLVVGALDVIDALQNFWPADADNNLLTFEPMCVGSGRAPRRRGRGDDPAARGWAEQKLYFDLPMVLPLDQSWQ